MLANMKRMFLVFAALVTTAILVASFSAPRLIESRFNRVLAPQPYKVSEKAKALHGRLTIVDLHTDSLLWGRDLLTKSSVGHVDIPRLREGNVAVQVFSVVTKTPRSQNINRNSGDSDLIGALAIAEHWPPRTWGSLKHRALYQAERLRGTAQDSNGRLLLIRRSTHPV